MKRVLIVRLSSIGDLFHVYPALVEAKRNRPDLAFDWCVDQRFVGVMRLLPGPDAIIANDAYGKPKDILKPDRWRAVPRLHQRLREGRYDLAIDAHGLLRSALVARASRAPVVGYAMKDASEWFAAPFYDRRISAPPGLKASMRTRRLFAAALTYEVDEAWQPTLLGRRVVDPQRAFLVHGASVEAKRWPLENWIQLARVLDSRGYRLCTTWWGETERAFAEQIAAAVPSVEIVGGRAVEEVGERVASCGLVVGNDTGLTHYADLAGCATVVMFSASNSVGAAPSGARSRAVYRDQRPVILKQRDSAQALPPERHPTVAQVLAAIDEVTG